MDGVVLNYVKLHAEYWSNTFKVIYPSDITSSIHSLSTNNTPKFQKERQHDAQELLVEIKDMLCESITGVSELFQGSLESILTCNSCKATRSTLDPYKDLQVEIGEVDKSLASCIKDYKF